MAKIVFYEWSSPRKGPGTEEFFFKKALILAFEVIVQLPKHTFEIGFFLRYSSLCIIFLIFRTICNIIIIILILLLLVQYA